MTTLSRRGLLAGLGALASSPAWAECGSGPLLTPGSDRGQHRGMCLAHLHRGDRGYGSASSAEQLARLASLGVTHVSLTPFGYVGALDSEEIRWGSQLDPSMTDLHLEAEAAQARALGLKVCLKPHIWSRAFWSGKASRQDIRPRDWARWFASYQGFALHYAALAERMGASVFCVGLEYLNATQDNPGAWGRVARACREVYSGQLTYGANWWAEAKAFQDWADFDLVGVNAYYPLKVGSDPSVEQLLEAWEPHVRELCELSAAADRPVVFAEAGLMAVRGAALEPWNQGLEGEPDGELQARYYLALLQAFGAQPWWRGVYWWKWFTAEAQQADPYCPMGQPAEKVLDAWWGQRLRSGG